MKTNKFFKKTIFLLIYLICINFQNTINAQGKCLAGISDKTKMEANPEHKINSIFHFDYKIVCNIKAKRREKITKIDNLTGYVNSEDGSMFFPKNSVPSSVLRTLVGRSSMEDDDWKFMGAIMLSNGQMVLYIKEKDPDAENPKVAFTAPISRTSDNLLVDQYMLISRFFNNIADKLTPQEHIEPLPSDSKWIEESLGYFAEIPGRSGIQKITMYVDLKPTDIATGRPMVGFFVGVVKDFRIAKCNRLVVFYKNKQENGDYIQAELVLMTKEPKTFNATAYEPKVGFIPAPTTNAEAKSLGDKVKYLTNKKMEISHKLKKLAEEKARCLRNSDKKYCDSRYDPRIKRLEEQNKKLTKDFIEGFEGGNRYINRINDR